MTTSALVRGIVPNPFPYNFPPFEKQREALKRSAFEKNYALLMEPGTGKTFVAICTAAAQWYKGWIDCMVVIAPNGVHTNWLTDEIPKHLPKDIPHTTIHWLTGRMTSKHRKAKTRAAIADMDKLLIVAVNVDAISHQMAKRLIEHVCRKRRGVLMVLDESSDIANPSSDRSRAAHRLARFAFSRRILNGTPGNAMKLYSQFKFLDWRILGHEKWHDYQLAYGVFRSIDTGECYKNGRPKFLLIQERDEDGKKRYKNVDELQRRMYSAAFRCTKDECFDLPPKLYAKVYPVLNAEQHRLYADLVQDFETQYRGREVTVSNKLVLYLRLQQIVCGYVPVDPLADEEHQPVLRIDGPNHRLNDLRNYVEHHAGVQGIIWSRFTLDIDVIRAMLRELGVTFVEYHGGITSSMAREHAKRAFQAGDAQWFVGNAKAGGRGLTLTAARVMAYYSNYFGHETRVQSEDRGYRYGTVSLTITDFLARDTIDEIIVRALRNDQDVADALTGDIPRPHL